MSTAVKSTPLKKVQLKAYYLPGTSPPGYQTPLPKATTTSRHLQGLLGRFIF
jgi:hypothetical protein